MLHMAMVQGAIYGAVNTTKAGTPFLPGLPAASPSASVDAAVATAAHDVLVGLGTDPPMPEAVVTRIDGLTKRRWRRFPTAPTRRTGSPSGPPPRRRCRRREPTTVATCRSPIPWRSAGEWRPLPPDEVNDRFAWVAKVRPSRSIAVAVPLGGAARTRQCRVCHRVRRGQGPRRRRWWHSPEQQAIAEFHVNTVEMYNRTFRTVAEAQGLTLAEEARLFAMANGATANSPHQLFGRQGQLALLPSNHRHPRGRKRRQPQHRRRPISEPLLPSPPYPDHPSGYNCLTAGWCTAPTPSSAGADRLSLVEIDPTPPSQPEYAEFTDKLAETIDARASRVSASEPPRTGEPENGTNVAESVATNYFQPASAESTASAPPTT